MAVATYRECEVEEEEGGGYHFFFLCGCFSLILDGERLSAASRCDCLFFFFFLFPLFFLLLPLKVRSIRSCCVLPEMAKEGERKKKNDGKFHLSGEEGKTHLLSLFLLSFCAFFFFSMLRSF